MFNLEQINQQIDNIKNISLTLNDTPIYNTEYEKWLTMSEIVLLVLCMAFLAAISISCIGDSVSMKIFGLFVGGVLVALIALEMYGSKLEREYTFEHRSDKFGLFHEGKYKFDTKVDIINKSYHDMFGEKYVSLPEIRDHLKIEFLHADEFKKLSDTEQEEIMKTIDELTPDLTLMMRLRKFLIGQ